MSTRRQQRTDNRRTRNRKKRRPSADRSAAGGSTAWRRNGTALPEWGDLAPEKNARIRTSEEGLLARISTGRFAAMLLVFAIAFTAYVGHVHATQDLFERVQAERQENQHLHLQHERLQGELDRATGPRAVHERAQEMGFEESLTLGPAIHIDVE